LGPDLVLTTGEIVTFGLLSAAVVALWLPGRAAGGSPLGRPGAVPAPAGSGAA